MTIRIAEPAEGVAVNDILFLGLVSEQDSQPYPLYGIVVAIDELGMHIAYPDVDGLSEVLLGLVVGHHESSDWTWTGIEP